MKSICEFAIELAMKNLKGRSLVILGYNEEICYLLQKNRLINVIKVNGDEGLESYSGTRDKNYILVSNQTRTEDAKKKLDNLGYREIEDYVFVYGMKRFVTQELYVNTSVTDTMNIMTVSSAEMMMYFLIQLQMFHDMYSEKRIRAFILYQKSLPDVERVFNRLKRYASVYDNIEVHGIPIGKDELYDEMRSLTKAGHWPKCVYYKWCAWEYLPEDVDRILFMDNGDQVLNDDISPYYYADFEGKSLIVSVGVGSKKIINGKLMPYEKKDLCSEEARNNIGFEAFNTGFIVMNIEKMRRLKFDEKYLVDFLKSIVKKFAPGKDRAEFIFSEQGLGNILYLEDVKFYGMEEFNDIRFMPFNQHCRFFYDGNELMDTYYEPAVFHFCGFIKPPYSFKPWKQKYPTKLNYYQSDVETFSPPFPKANKYYLQWYEAAKKVESIMDQVDNICNLKYAREISGISVLEDYLDALMTIADDYLLCISILDTAGYSVSNRVAKQLVRLGLPDLRKEHRWSYILVRNKGEILVNELDGFAMPTEDKVIVDSHEIILQSKPFTKGSQAKIIIDGVDFAMNTRGLNIVVADIESNKLVDTVSFDTLLPDNTCYRRDEIYYLAKNYDMDAVAFSKMCVPMMEMDIPFVQRGVQPS